MKASSQPKQRLPFIPPTSSIPASHLLWNAQDSDGRKYPVDAYSRTEYFWGQSCGFVIPYVPLLRVQLNGQQSCKLEAWLLQFLTTGHRHSCTALHSYRQFVLLQRMMYVPGEMQTLPAPLLAYHVSRSSTLRRKRSSSSPRTLNYILASV
ncbi:hypothetical protein BJX68DRAFT_220198 [Aspergillus pseudodeflectus]|uniref:Uncharacterized protein n=1 Tax=Aspergillus pseudodeflectus TaxID=176178 RepID=A0ABR4JDK5_9EURO